MQMDVERFLQESNNYWDMNELNILVEKGKTALASFSEGVSIPKVSNFNGFSLHSPNSANLFGITSSDLSEKENRRDSIKIKSIEIRLFPVYIVAKDFEQNPYHTFLDTLLKTLAYSAIAYEVEKLKEEGFFNKDFANMEIWDIIDNASFDEDPIQMSVAYLILDFAKSILAEMNLGVMYSDYRIENGFFKMLAFMPPSSPFYQSKSRLPKHNHFKSMNIINLLADVNSPNVFKDSIELSKPMSKLIPKMKINFRQ